MRNLQFTFILFLFHYQVYSQKADSSAYHPKWYQSEIFKAIAVPSILIGYGVSVIGNNGFPVSSRQIQGDIKRHFPNFHTHIDNYTVLMPVVALYGLDAAGVKSKHSFIERSILYALSGTFANMTTFIVKKSTHVLRPDSSTYNSFPSGHSSNAFVSAEFMHQELKDQSIWYSVGGYSVATATGMMRMLNNRHWLSDVLAGAGIGMLSTKVTYLIYPWIQQKISRRNRENMGVMPIYNGQVLGFVFVYVFK